jgi:hypothetical protein
MLCFFHCFLSFNNKKSYNFFIHCIISTAHTKLISFFMSFICYNCCTSIFLCISQVKFFFSFSRERERKKKLNEVRSDVELERNVEPAVRTISKHAQTLLDTIISSPASKLWDDSHHPPAKKNIFKMLVLIDLNSYEEYCLLGSGSVCSSRSFTDIPAICELLAQYMATHPRRWYSSGH